MSENVIEKPPYRGLYHIIIFVYIMLDCRIRLPFNELLRWILPVLLIVLIATRSKPAFFQSVLFSAVIIWFLVACFYSTSFQYSIMRWISFVLISMMHYSYYVFTRKCGCNNKVFFNYGMLFVLYGFINIFFPHFGISGRNYGITGNPNSLGLWSCIAFTFAIYYFRKEEGSKRKLLFFVLIVTAYLAFTSGSRTYSVCIIIDIVYCIFAVRNMNYKSLLIVIPAMYLIIKIIPSDYQFHITGLQRLATEGIERESIWDYGEYLIKQRPLLGYGYGISQSLNMAAENEGLAFHNSYITVLVETGYVGLSLVIMHIANRLFKAILCCKYNFSIEMETAIVLVLNMLLCFYGGSAMTSVGSTEGFFFWGLLAWISSEVNSSTIG